MTIPKKVTYTRGGGNYVAAHVFYYATILVLLGPLLILLLIGLLNPFWFRDDYLRVLQNLIEKITARRNYQMYKIYLGTDPEVWHTLKD